MNEEEIWTMELGDDTYTVPRLPFKYSRKVYPICQRLSNAGLAARVILPKEPLQLTDEEVDDLGTIAFLACQAAEPNMTQEVFDEMPITPPQLFDAFFTIRKACGGWRVRTEDQEEPGEAQGTEKSPTSTLTDLSDDSSGTLDFQKSTA